MDDNTAFMILDEEDAYFAINPTPILDPPSMDTIEVWTRRGYCQATDGCRVQVDGYCPHGHPSWLIELGLI